MNQKLYVCTGGCGAVISEVQYNDGLKSCGADVCSHKGQSFEERIKCDLCSVLYKEGEEHRCQ
ncbi:MAG TPA: hypothetical protein VJB63_01730 [Patescibacteria group bacterium]|nr:hypothetical protein [Patescibacteria group bacterium]